MKKTRFARSFYGDRHLPRPAAEHWPEDSRELRRLIEEPGDDAVPRILLGDGQHVRPPTLGERAFEVIRTEKCAAVLSVDLNSKLIRVEAGARWRDLQELANERGLSMQRYRLYPSTATIGGLLARHQALPKHLFYGDLRDGCVALSAASPGSGRYRYIPAPRKASGPDLRHLFIGGEGLLGAILDVTLVAWRPAYSHLYTWRVDGLAGAAATARALFHRGVRPSWCVYEGRRQELIAAVHAPGTLLQAIDQELRTSLGEGLTIGGHEEVELTRRRFEDRHPDRRHLSASACTVALTLSLADLALLDTELGATAQAIDVHDWSAHAATAYVTWPEGAPLELGEPLRRRALDLRPLLDDRSLSWPEWAQTLKRRLDDRRLLATGP